MALPRFWLLIVFGVFFFLVGLVLPVAGGALASYEEDRVGVETADTDCDIDPGDHGFDGNESVQTGTVTVEEECLAERETVREDDQRSWVLHVASALTVGGWVLRIGGIIWVWMAFWARRGSRL